ncbi:MAG TPA: hypothetical protein VJB39_02395 [Patescibacteria group bacterium]|nr:hypothetical protein [Patescibacteria group bacterium]
MNGKIPVSQLECELAAVLGNPLPFGAAKLLDGFNKGIVLIKEVREGLLWEFPELGREKLAGLLGQ